MASSKKILVVQIAALSEALVARVSGTLAGLKAQPLDPVFPALTCVAQATFRTAALPRAHGMIANGCFDRALRKALFWEQASSLVDGPRIWDAFRAQGGTVGMMFWQQSLGEDVDLIVSPRPIHKHSGGMIQAVYSKPAQVYDNLCKRVGRPFNLFQYWGPLAGRKASYWIVDAVCAVLDQSDVAPDLLLTYLPHLDYDVQRHGPDHPKASAALDVTMSMLALLASCAQRNGYEFVMYGDYAIGPASRGAIFPNRVLREVGLLGVQNVRGMAYPDLFDARAWAMVDHEVAHVYVRRDDDLPAARAALQKLPGVAHVLDREQQTAWGVDHPRAGELVLIAEDGAWFAYPWWSDKREAPDFAGHVDIHNKPGFDPCELFFGWPPGSVSMNTQRVGGTHGRIGENRRTVWASSLTWDRPVQSLTDLSGAVRDWLSDAK